MYEGWIESAKSDIENAEKELANGDPTQEAYKSQIESQIKAQEARIEVLQKLAESAKADLDAAMEEETPAE